MLFANAIKKILGRISFDSSYSCSHTVVVFVYNPVSYISRDRPKSDTLAILCLPKRTFLAAKSRWTICQNMKNSKAHLLERSKNLR